MTYNFPEGLPEFFDHMDMVSAQGQKKQKAVPNDLLVGWWNEHLVNHLGQRTGIAELKFDLASDDQSRYVDFSILNGTATGTATQNKVSLKNFEKLGGVFDRQKQEAVAMLTVQYLLEHNPTATTITHSGSPLWEKCLQKAVDTRNENRKSGEPEIQLVKIAKDLDGELDYTSSTKTRSALKVLNSVIPEIKKHIPNIQLKQKPKPTP